MQLAKLTKRFTPRNLVIGGVVGVLLSIGLGLALVRARSPELKRDEAINALEARNAEALIRLADPVEVSTLKLTPDKVRTLLGHTLWQSSTSKHSGIVRGTGVPRDQSFWEVSFTGSQSGIRRVIVPVIDTPGISWKLNLSMMLRSSCFWRAGSAEGPGLYRRLAKEAGITGLREQNGDFVTIEVLEERTAQIEAARRQQ